MQTNKRSQSPWNVVILTWHPEFFHLAPTCLSSFLCTLHIHTGTPTKLDDSLCHQGTTLFFASGPWFLHGMSVHPSRPIIKVPEAVADLSLTSPNWKVPPSSLAFQQSVSVAVSTPLGCAFLKHGCFSAPAPHATPCTAPSNKCMF